MPTPDKPKRPRKTPRQRAEEALATATRIADRLERQIKDATARAAHLEREHQAAVRRRDYLAQSPDLPPKPEPETPAMPA